MIRLDKYLADMGVGSRQEVKQQIRKGTVSVDGQIIKTPETKVDPQRQSVCVHGEPVGYAAYEYFMLNKPAGVISAVQDKKDTTVVDIIESKKRKDLFPVGRLDKDTEGLLLVTNDGALAHRLLSPKKHVDKVYYARIKGCVTEETIRVFKEGVNIGTEVKAEWTKPAALEIIESAPFSVVRITIQEGKFHQVKRMFQAVEMEVLYLKRERMGSLHLDERLTPGEYRELTQEELELLL